MKELIDDINKFFDTVLPLEFTNRPWYSKFWIRIVEKHPYLAFLAPAEGRENYTAKKWMCMAFEFLNLVFIDTIMAPLAAPDPEVCYKYTTTSECLKPSSIDLIDPLCSWNSEERICEFREIDQNMGIIIITTLIIKLVEFPLMSLCEYLVDQAGSVPPARPTIAKESSSKILSIYSPRTRKYDDEFIPEELEADEFYEEPLVKVLRKVINKDASVKKESTQVLIRLAARLSYLQSHADKVTIEEEVEYLMTHADLQLKSNAVKELRLELSSRMLGVDQLKIDTLKLVHRARDVSCTVLKELEEKASQDEKEVYLVKRFVVELLKGIRRRVAERFFFDDVESEITLEYRVFCTIVLILIIAGELTYVFLTGVGLGANATRVWFICLAVIVLQGRLLQLRKTLLTFFCVYRYYIAETPLYMVHTYRDVLHNKE